MPVPFVPTPRDVIIEMLKLAGPRSGEVLVDPGAGDCRVVIIGAKLFDLLGIAIEIQPSLVRYCMEQIQREKLEDKIVIVWGDLLDFDYSVADIVTLYLGSELNEKLRPKLERELKPGTRIVSHDFEVPGWKPEKIVKVRSGRREHTLYLYVIPDSLRQKV